MASYSTDNDRMADLSPLANALSPQVLAFLRTFLASR
mgnify:CR=1 FL=1